MTLKDDRTKTAKVFVLLGRMDQDVTEATGVYCLLHEEKMEILV